MKSKQEIKQWFLENATDRLSIFKAIRIFNTEQKYKEEIKDSILNKGSHINTL